MIVKNEEKHLPACLDALEPLLCAVPSELVIVDTGSTDKTLEIALKYTNEIHRFDWADDFAAARNFGLGKCRGQWFMFLDADEHFGDVTDLINFFNTPDFNKDYNSAFYVIRNYTTPEHDVYLTLNSRRIARRTEALSFTGAIHEYLNAPDPVCYLNSYVWHYGYAFENERRRREKDERNLVLLEKELLEKPGDIRTITHILALGTLSLERKHELIEEALPRLGDDAFSFALLHCAYTVYGEAGEVDRALEFLDMTERKAKPGNAVLSEVYAARAVLLYRRHDYAEAAKNIEKYLGYYEKDIRGELDRAVFGCVGSNYLNPESQAEMKYTLALCHEALGAEQTYLALKSNTDLGDELEKLNHELISAHLNFIAEHKPDLPQLAINYRDEQFYVQSIKHLLFGSLLFEAGLKGAGRSGELDYGEKAALYGNYAKYISLYTANIYNPGLFNDADIGALPESHRFGLYVTAAQRELDSGNKVGYIRELKKALVSCAAMTNVIKFLLEEFSAGL
jgi:glycosyltransferase involved in cell wall biosynthesis